MDDRLALAKAAFASKSQMIANSEIIALVEIKKVETTDARGESWTYRNKATAQPIKVLKGEFPVNGTIYGGENFICASVNLKEGKALVFLNHDHDLLIGSNWHLSIRPVSNDSVEWFDGEAMSPLKPVKLAEAIEQIESVLGPDPKLKKLSGPLREVAFAAALHDGVVGEAPAPAKEWQAYQKALPQAREHKRELQSIIKNGSPAGRIYAALLLYKADKEEGKTALASLSSCKSTIKYQSGCRGTTCGMWQVASDLYSNGKYINLSLP